GLPRSGFAVTRDSHDLGVGEQGDVVVRCFLAFGVEPQIRPDLLHESRPLVLRPAKVRTQGNWRRSAVLRFYLNKPRRVRATRSRYAAPRSAQPVADSAYPNIQSSTFWASMPLSGSTT